MPQSASRRASGPSLVRKAFAADLAPLDDRQVRVRVSTEQADRSGDVVVQKGIGLANFLKSRTVLWNHDQDHPIARCEDIGVKAEGVEALVQFPEPGVSAKADEVYGLIKAGVINATSIGFLPLDAEPADGRSPRKGLRIPKSDLMEFSFVSVPANSGAEVLQRAFAAQAGGADGVAEPPKLTRKGLYAVSQLARLLQELGYAYDGSVDERAREGDASTVPDQLRDALGKLGAALVAMTSEEVAELLGQPGNDGVDREGDLVALDDDVILLHLGLKSPAEIAAMWKALGPDGALQPMVKEGRRFSAGTRAALTKHLDAIGAGHKAMCDMLDEEGEDDEADDGDAKDDATKALGDQRRRLTEVLALAHEP